MSCCFLILFVICHFQNFPLPKESNWYNITFYLEKTTPQLVDGELYYISDAKIKFNEKEYDFLYNRNIFFHVDLEELTGEFIPFCEKTAALYAKCENDSFFDTPYFQKELINIKNYKTRKPAFEIPNWAAFVLGTEQFVSSDKKQLIISYEVNCEILLVDDFCPDVLFFNEYHNELNNNDKFRKLSKPFVFPYCIKGFRKIDSVIDYVRVEDKDLKICVFSDLTSIRL